MGTEGSHQLRKKRVTEAEASSPHALVAMVEGGAELAGEAAVNAATYLAQSLLGAMGGERHSPQLTHALVDVAGEIGQRTLGDREKERIGATLAFAVEKIRRNLRQWNVRDDGFFQQQPSERASAEEILEGVLLEAQRDHEEKKLRFYGTLYANIAFKPWIDRAQANALIRVGEDLTYRQLCLLSLFHSDRTPMVHARRRFEPFFVVENQRGLTALLHEIFDLGARGLVRMHDVDPRFTLKVSEKHGTATIIGVMKPWAMGAMLYELMELEEVDNADLEVMKALLPQYQLTDDELCDWALTAPPPHHEELKGTEVSEPPIVQEQLDARQRPRLVRRAARVPRPS